ncbi:MAG TPA: four-helix bundle copper-binding protein [Bacillales bacterium]|nr:four-helix bundle copper-binding protein [Bacillales bacterium]
MDESFKECMKACWACVEACNHCYDACLKEENLSDMVDCIRLTQECAAVCSYAAEAISRHSLFTEEIGALCAVVCESCGNECKKHKAAHCKTCAAKCLDCAEKCRKLGA